MTNHPTITIVTPVMNAVDTIERCINSIQKQDYPNIEHIIVDGGSSDGTLDIIRKYGIPYVSEPDAGVYDAFSKGVQRANGDIINILNADDFFYDATTISKVVEFMITRKLDLCHGQIEQVSADGAVRRVIGKRVSKYGLFRKMRVAHPSVFVQRHVYEKYGAFSIGFKIAGDHEFALRVWDKIKIDYIPEVIAKMQLGGVSNSQVISSYRESMAATLLHGQSPLKALCVYYFECLINIHRIVRQWSQK